jgi:hypothetical protein
MIGSFLTVDLIARADHESSDKNARIAQNLIKILDLQIERPHRDLAQAAGARAVPRPAANSGFAQRPRSGCHAVLGRSYRVNNPIAPPSPKQPFRGKKNGRAAING